ncbi:MAG: hypothetical protein OHK0021_20610 [Bryobacter sp.]
MPLTYNPKVHDVEVVHAQFNRLMNELIKGTISRNTFQPWEIELLLDIQSADLGRYSEREIYKRYQKAVQRAYERGAKMPMKLSEYLEGLKSKRVADARGFGEIGDGLDEDRNSAVA